MLILKLVLLHPIARDVDLGVGFAADDAVPDHDGVFYLQGGERRGTCCESMKAGRTPLALVYSASRYRKSCFVFQLKRGERSVGVMSSETIQNRRAISGERKRMRLTSIDFKVDICVLVLVLPSFPVRAANDSFN